MNVPRYNETEISDNLCTRQAETGQRRWTFRETSYFFPDILIYNSRKKNSSRTAGVKTVTAAGHGGLAATC